MWTLIRVLSSRLRCSNFPNNSRPFRSNAHYTFTLCHSPSTLFSSSHIDYNLFSLGSFDVVCGGPLYSTSGIIQVWLSIDCVIHNQSITESTLPRCLPAQRWLPLVRKFGEIGSFGGPKFIENERRVDDITGRSGFRRGNKSPSKFISSTWAFLLLRVLRSSE